MPQLEVLFFFFFFGQTLEIRGVHQTAQIVKIAPKSSIKWYNRTAL